MASTESPARTAPREPEPTAVTLLVPPAITAVAVILMLVVARIYDSLPLQAPACGLRAATGIPCVACGGTRSMMALSHGHFTEALAFNPLAFLGVIASGIWLLVALVRYFFFFPAPDSCADPFANRKRLPLWSIVTGIVLLFLSNWFYLFLFLPE